MFWSSPPWEEVCFWSLDLETGGLDARVDPILAVGMVPVRGGAVRMGQCYRSLVRPSAPISPDSMRAHQLVPHELKSAPTLAEVMDEVAPRVSEGVLLVHYGSIDIPFLRRAFRETGHRWASPKVVDTVQLLMRLSHAERFLHPHRLAEGPQLNLGRARSELGLPAYGAHDALLDAIATAELFLVLRSRLGARTLRDLR